MEYITKHMRCKEFPQNIYTTRRNVRPRETKKTTHYTRVSKNNCFSIGKWFSVAFRLNVIAYAQFRIDFLLFLLQSMNIAQNWPNERILQTKPKRKGNIDCRVLIVVGTQHDYFYCKVIYMHDFFSIDKQLLHGHTKEQYKSRRIPVLHPPSANFILTNSDSYSNAML